MILKKSDISSIILAVVCSTFLISNYFRVFFSIYSNIGDYILICMSILLILMQLKKKIRISYYYLSLLVILPFAIGILISNGLKNGNVIILDYAKYFIAYALIAFITTRNTVNVELLLRSMMIFVIPIVATGNSFWIGTSVERIGGTSTSMGASYALLPSVIAFILHFSYFRKRNKLNLVLYIVNAYCCFRLIISGTRGSLIGIMMIVFYVLVDRNKDKANGKKMILSYGILISVISFTLSKIDLIITNIYQLLSKNGVYINVINKSYNEIVRNSTMLNGREKLWDDARSIILLKSSGVGVGGYEDIYGIYPHNIIMQLLLEYGWIVGIALITVLLVLFFKGITYNMDSKIIIVLYFFCSIPRLIVSSTYWKDEFFWLFLIYSSFTIWKNRKEKINAMILNETMDKK